MGLMAGRQICGEAMKDSFEKLARDLANKSLADMGTWEEISGTLSGMIWRARRLIKEHDNGQKKITEMLERAQEVRVKNGGEE